MKFIAFQRGSLLLEMALVLGILAVVIPPMLNLSQSQNAALAESLHQRERQKIEQAIEGFVLSRGRLPCPALEGETLEQFTNGQCTIQSGDLPVASLSLNSMQHSWSIAVADLAAAGPPAQHALHNPNRWQQLSLQQLSEIILNPVTTAGGMTGSALPALSICNLDNTQTLPDGSERGCGLQSLHSPTAVLVVQPKSPRGAPFGDSGSAGELASLHQINALRNHQFFIVRDYSSDNPMWMSYERLVHLWMEGGWITQTPSS